MLSCHEQRHLYCYLMKQRWGKKEAHSKLSSLITDPEYFDLLIYDMFYSLVEGCQLPEGKTVFSFRVNNERLTLLATAGSPTSLAKSNTVL